MTQAATLCHARGVFDLSVVIPLYNGAQFIAPTLDSLAAQTVPPREIIVVDDGSTDGGADIAESYRLPTGLYPIVLHNRASEGVARTRNRGVAHAQGEWVGLCDNDDLWHPRRIELLERVSRDFSDAQAIATAAWGFALEADRRSLENDRRSPLINSWVIDDNITTLVDSLPKSEVQGGTQHLYFDDFQRDPQFLTTQVCFRHELYSLVGGSPPWPFRSDDYFLHASLSMVAPIIKLEAPLVFYRIRPDSESRNESDQALAILSASVALRLCVQNPDRRHAGELYRHLLTLQVDDGAPMSRILAFGTLGKLNTRELASLIKRRLGRDAKKVLDDLHRLKVGGVRRTGSNPSA